MIDVPFFDWLFPRDRPLLSKEESSRGQQKSKVAASSKASKPNSGRDGGSATGGGSNGGGGKSSNDSTRPGSWIIKHDPNGVPYWINDVSGEATYQLFTPHVGVGMPIRHVESRQPHYLCLPITPLPSPTAGSKGCNNNTNNNTNSNKNKSDNGDGSVDADRSGEQNKATKNKKAGDGGGSWEEKYHPVTGAKSWYHTRTKKTTTKDPFF